jgi:hypothetical protein
MQQQIEQREFDLPHDEHAGEKWRATTSVSNTASGKAPV